MGSRLCAIFGFVACALLVAEEILTHATGFATRFGVYVVLYYILHYIFIMEPF